MIRSDESGTMITGSDIETVKWITVRRALILKIDTGLNLTRVSPLSVARRDGITSKRTNRAALVDVNAWLEQRGVRSVWSKTHPEG